MSRLAEIRTQVDDFVVVDFEDVATLLLIVEELVRVKGRLFFDLHREAVDPDDCLGSPWCDECEEPWPCAVADLATALSKVVDL